MNTKSVIAHFQSIIAPLCSRYLFAIFILGNFILPRAIADQIPYYSGTITVVNDTPYTVAPFVYFLDGDGDTGNFYHTSPQTLQPGQVGAVTGIVTAFVGTDGSPGWAPDEYGVAMVANDGNILPPVPRIYSANSLPISLQTPSCNGVLYLIGQTNADDNNDFPPTNCGCSTCGMPVWSVSEPYISLWLKDEPLGYQPAVGPRISFGLAFKQREIAAGFNTNIFSVGKRWNCSWLSYVAPDTNGNEVVYYPGGGQRTYYTTNPPVDYLTDTQLTGSTNTGFTLLHPDGSQDVYGFIVTNTAGTLLKAFLTQHSNPQAQKSTFSYYPYNPANPVVRLQYLIDGDGHSNSIYYATNNLFSTNLISQVVDPFERTTTLAYDTNGCLTNITDVVGNSSAITYDASNWVHSLTTPYGTTSFTLTDTTGTNASPNGRSVLVTQPDGGHQLYLYTNNAPGVSNTYPAAAIPDTSPFSNTFDTTNLNLRDSFYWGPRQYANLSTTNISSFRTNDFQKAQMQHWLISDGATLSMERDPSPDNGGTIEGQKTWYDYGGKYLSSYQGTQVEPLFVARVLPDGTTSITRTDRNSFGAVTNEISTYSTGGTVAFRTNIYVYATNQIDLLITTNALGVQVSSNSYNAYHEVMTNYDALNEKTIYTYDASQRLTSTTFPTGLVATNIYSSDGLLATQIDIGIDIGYATNSYTYTNDLVLTHTDARGLATTNTWDNLNRLVSTAFPDGTFIANTYSKLDLVQTVDRMGFTNSFGYDNMRRKIAETNALGAVTTYSYCTCGSLDFILDAATYETQFFYDNQGNLTNTLYPDNYSVTRYYNLLKQVVSTSDSGGNGLTNTYNNQGLLTTVSNAFGQVQSISYDILDRATNTVNANGVSVATSYDNLNRPLNRSYPDGGIEHWGYTLNVSGATSYTNQIGNVATYVYDTLGRQTTNAVLGVTTNSFTYDGAGDRLTLTDGKNQTTSFGIDIYGNVTNKIDAAGNLVLVGQFDADNRMTNRWTPAKGSTAYSFDAVGNLTHVAYPVSPAISLSYDVLNRLTNMIDAVGDTAYSYDSVSELLSENGPWANDTVSYTYTNRLRTGLGLSQPSGSWSQSYGYDVARRLTNVTSQAGSFGYQYFGSGPSTLVSRLALPNGAYITNTFDSVARLLSTKLLNSSAAILDSESYAYNQAGQRTAETNTAGDFRNYTYDNAGELKTANGKESGGSSRWQEQLGYVYDAAGNLNYRTNNALVQTFNVNNLNELTTATASGTLTVAGTTTTPATSVTVNTSNAVLYADSTFASTNQPITNAAWNTYTAIAQDSHGRVSSNTVSVFLPAIPRYSYDLNGNLLSEHSPAGGTNRIFSYDDENQLVSVCVTNAWRSDFVYDGKFRRRIEKDYAWQGGAWVQTNEVHFIYDGNSVIQERDANNNPLVTYTRSGSSLLARTDNGQEIPGSPTTAYYHADGNGNVTTLIYSNQIIAAKYLYDPFGNTLSLSGPLASLNVYGFASKEWNSSADLYYFVRRYYDPTLQRFINRDPIAEQGGINLYAYVANNPINAIDLLGLELLWQSSSYGNPVSSTLPGLSGTWASGVYASGAGRYQNGALYQPDAIPPMDPVTERAGLFLASLPIAVAGGEFIGGAYAAGELGTGFWGGAAYVGANSALGATISVGNRAASQLIENGSINGRQLEVAALTGAAFGTVSAGLGAWGSSLERTATANIEQLEAQAAFTGSVGPFLESQEEVDAALLQAEANINQAQFLAQLQAGGLFTLDQLGLQLGEDYTYDELLALLGTKPPCQ